MERWGEALPAECVGIGSRRAIRMVKRARTWEGVAGEEGVGAGRGKKAKGLGHAGEVVARQESTHYYW